MEMMFRLTVLFVASILIFSYNVEGKTDSNREVRQTASLDPQPDLNSLLVDSFGNIGPIITFLKSQVRDIVIDIFIEVVKFLRVVLHDYKVKLFKRLGKYTLSDVFHFVFDGVFEFVGETDSNDTASIVNEASPEPSMYDPNYAFPEPYYVEKLIRSQKK